MSHFAQVVRGARRGISRLANCPTCEMREHTVSLIGQPLCAFKYVRAGAAREWASAQLDRPVSNSPKARQKRQGMQRDAGDAAVARLFVTRHALVRVPVIIESFIATAGCLRARCAIQCCCVRQRSLAIGTVVAAILRVSTFWTWNRCCATTKALIALATWEAFGCATFVEGVGVGAGRTRRCQLHCRPSWAHAAGAAFQTRRRG